MPRNVRWLAGITDDDVILLTCFKKKTTTQKKNKKIHHFWFAWWRWCHCVSDCNTWISSGPTGINAYPSDDKDHKRRPHTVFWQSSCPAAVLKTRCQSQASRSWVSVHLAWKTSAKQQDAVKPHSRSENTVRGRGQGNDGCCRIHTRGMKTEYLSSDFLILERSFLNVLGFDVWQSVSKTKRTSIILWKWNTDLYLVFTGPRGESSTTAPAVQSHTGSQHCCAHIGMHNHAQIRWNKIDLKIYFVAKQSCNAASATSIPSSFLISKLRE